MSCNDNIISVKVTTGNAPNKLKVTNNVVEFAYAITCNKQGAINKINVLPSKSILAPITIMVVDTISAVKSRRLLKVLLDSGSVRSTPFEECAVDLILIGPWIVQVCGNPYEFSALTVIETL